MIPSDTHPFRMFVGDLCGPPPTVAAAKWTWNIGTKESTGEGRRIHIPRLSPLNVDLEDASDAVMVGAVLDIVAMYGDDPPLSFDSRHRRSYDICANEGGVRWRLVMSTTTAPSSSPVVVVVAVVVGRTLDHGPMSGSRTFSLVMCSESMPEQQQQQQQ